MQPTYTLLDHTADLRLGIHGQNFADLYANAGLALFDLIARSDRQPSTETIRVLAEGSDPADLLVNFLRELLYLWTGDEKLANMINILQISETAINARVGTIPYAPGDCRLGYEIKAVTYHRIDVRQTKDGWWAEVVLDI